MAAKPYYDGATYDPGTHTWRPLPAVPVEHYRVAQAVWTGADIVLFTSSPGSDVTTIQVHSFDPASRQWGTLPPIHIPQDELLSTTALVTGNQLLVWAQHQSKSGGIHFGRDSFRYDPGSNAWKESRVQPLDTARDVNDPLWTGSYVYFPPGHVECDICTGLPSTNLRGTFVNTATGDAMWLAHGPVDDDLSSYAWTGRALLAYDSQSLVSGPSGHHGRGTTAAYDPGTNAWLVLQHAPIATKDGTAAQVWTGTELLIWGQFNNSASLLDAPSVNTTGLEFAPA